MVLDFITKPKSRMKNSLLTLNYNETIHCWNEDPITAGAYVLSIAIKNNDKQKNIDFKFSVAEKLVDESEMYEEEVVE